MIMRIQKRSQDNRGFTLTEIAIVLGIVGLILGAIWVAAAAVYNNLRVSKATTDLITIVQNVRSMYATTNTVDNAADMGIQTAPNAPVAYGKTTAYQQALVFPADMVTDNQGAGTIMIQNPWGGDTDIESAKSQVAGDAFSVNFDLVPNSACINLLTSNTGQGRDPGLVAAQTAAAGTLSFKSGAAAGGLIAFPVTAAVAGPKCSNGTNNVGFMFVLKA